MKKYHKLLFYFILFLSFRVKYYSNTYGSHQNQITTCVLKNIANGNCSKPINPFGTSVKITLSFLTEHHVIFTHGRHLTWYLVFWVPCHILLLFFLKKILNKKPKRKEEEEQETVWPRVASEPGMPKQKEPNQHCNYLEWSNVNEHSPDQREDDDDCRSSWISLA